MRTSRRPRGWSAAGGGKGGGTVVQAIGQFADDEQEASSEATSKQDGATNVNSPVRIDSWGDDGKVDQENSSSAASAAANENDTDQSTSQEAGGGYGGTAVQAIEQDADNDQDASSEASSDQYCPTNVNAPVRIYSKGGGGKVEQTNKSDGRSAAGNSNGTRQRAWQGSGSSPKMKKALAAKRVA
jgi:hypothetical protein